MPKTIVRGHLLSLFTCFLWGTTFIGTKILLKDFTPLEILVTRFVLAYLTLWVMAPRVWREPSLKDELYFALAGLSGVTVYYLLENIALTYTYAANVSIIVSTAPLFTGLFAMLFLKGGRLKASFFLGFVAAMAGISMISLGGDGLKVSPRGDIMSLVAAAVWGVYSVVLEKISERKYSMVLVTRRIFFYGILFMLPVIPFLDFAPDLSAIGQMENLLTFLFLGVLCGAGGFVFWNMAMGMLGAVATSVYIYLIPVITIIAGWAVLKEPVSSSAVLGTILILGGLLLSQSGGKA